jgi:transposase
MGKLKIRKDRTPAMFAQARKGRDGQARYRLLAIANALCGMSRAEAAESAGMDRQTLRDWVIRYNKHGVAGLCDRWKGGRPPMLTPEEQAELLALVMAGPDPEKDGICALTRKVKTWWRWPRRDSASRCTPRRWDASCDGWASLGKRHGRATRSRIRPPRKHSVNDAVEDALHNRCYRSVPLRQLRGIRRSRCVSRRHPLASRAHPGADDV